MIPRLNVFARNYWDDQPGATWENRIDITDAVKAQVGSFGVGPTDFIWDDWKNTITITNPPAVAQLMWAIIYRNYRSQNH